MTISHSQWTRLRSVLAATAVAGLGVVVSSPSTSIAAQIDASPDYCSVETSGTTVEVVRPGPSDDPPVIDDVNWFARPVPNPEGHWIVAYGRHNLNYLYDLTTGRQVRIPDESDAVATPDGRYMTVPSHYTATDTINFYDLPTLLGRLALGEDGADVPPIFAHAHADLADVYYQSVGIVSDRGQGPAEVTVYRMMFSGGNHPDPPGFRIIDYEFRRENGATTVLPSAPMRLCPQIVKDMATPFISKDGRYVVAHDDGYPQQAASLKIFEITDVDPVNGTTTCDVRVDFGFAAGKADFSFDNSMLTFHISKHAYLTPFVNGGIAAPTITDVVVVDLEQNDAGDIIGSGGLARVTTSQSEGVGSYFPAFMPDGRLFYISNTVPKNQPGAKRFEFRVVNPAEEIRKADLFTDTEYRARAATIGELWRTTCAPTMEPFQPGEAEWSFLSVGADACRRLVTERWTAASPNRGELLAACARLQR